MVIILFLGFLFVAVQSFLKLILCGFLGGIFGPPPLGSCEEFLSGNSGLLLLMSVLSP